jgi:hypothetical protein
MKHLFEVWMDPEHSDDEGREFSFHCLVETPDEAIRVAAITVDCVDWVTYENLGVICVIEYNPETETQISWDYDYQSKSWIAGEAYKLPTQAIPMDLEKVQDWVNGIDEGAGWASDDYVIICDDLTDSEKYNLLLRGSIIGMIYDEDEIPEDWDLNGTPSMRSMNFREITEQYGYLIHPDDGKPKTN